MYEPGDRGDARRLAVSKTLCVEIYGMKNWSLRRFHFIYRAEVLDNATRHNRGTIFGTLDI